jgi:hypothetical protein
MLYSDFSLLPTSPALDYGDNSKVPAGITKDLYGNDRIQNATGDIGAVEGVNSLSSETFVKSSLKVYPNPVKNNVTIQSNEMIDTINLYNYAGQEIKIEKLNNAINMSSLASGIYILKVKMTNGAESIEKVIKE